MVVLHLEDLMLGPSGSRTATLGKIRCNHLPIFTVCRQASSAYRGRSFRLTKYTSLIPSGHIRH